MPDEKRVQEFVAARVPPNNLFKIPLLTELDVERFLRNLDIRKATGLDYIDAKFLKLAAPFLLKTLKEICILSINTTLFKLPGRSLKFLHCIRVTICCWER